MTGAVGFQEDLEERVQAFGFGGRDGCDRLRLICEDPYRRAALADRLGEQDPDGPGLLAAWVKEGCPRARGSRYAAFFDDIEAWTEFWDLGRPGTCGRFHLGDGAGETGALGILLTGGGAYRRWTDYARSHRDPVGIDRRGRFLALIVEPRIRAATLSLDLVLTHAYRTHFGHLPADEAALTFFDAMHRYGADTLPPTPRRAELLPVHDRYTRLAHRHTMRDPEGWFHWGAALEGAAAVGGSDGRAPFRRVWLAGLVVGCAADYARPRRGRTRPAYALAGSEPWGMTRRALALSRSLDEAAAELRDLYVIRDGDGPRDAVPTDLLGSEVA